MHSYKAGWRLVNQYSVCFHGCAVGAKALGRQPRCCLSMNSVIESGRVQSQREVVKSSQVKSSSKWRRPWKKTSFGAPRWRERSGGQISAQPAPLESPASGHHPHRLALDLLIIAATTYIP